VWDAAVAEVVMRDDKDTKLATAIEADRACIEGVRYRLTDILALTAIQLAA
jgi:hypothetical protein